MSASQNEVFFLDSDTGLYASYTYLDPEYVLKQIVSHQILVFVSSWALYNAKCRNEWLEVCPNYGWVLKFQFYWGQMSFIAYEWISSENYHSK